MKASEKNYYAKHFVALSALFVLGNAVITAPVSEADRFNFLAFFAAAAMAVLVYFTVLAIPLNKITLIPIILVAFYCIADALITFIKFIQYNLLPQVHPFLVVLPFLTILVYVVFQRVDMILKFSLFCFVPALAVILFFFLATAKDFNVKNIFINSLPNAKSFCAQIVPYIKGIVLPSVLLAVFGREEKMKKSTAFCGLGLGLVLFGVCFLNSVLLFGIELASRLDFPFSSAGSTVTFGNLFTRMDGFLYFVFLVTCVVKCAVGIFVIKKSKGIITL